LLDGTPRPDSAEGSNPVSFAVAHIQNSSRIYKHAMRSSERTSMGIGFWSIALLTRAQYRSNEARGQRNLANSVVFSVSHVQQIARPRQAFWSTQPRQARSTTIARIPLLPGPGHVMKSQGFAIHAVNRVALA